MPAKNPLRMFSRSRTFRDPNADDDVDLSNSESSSSATFSVFRSGRASWMKKQGSKGEDDLVQGSKKRVRFNLCPTRYESENMALVSKEDLWYTVEDFEREKSNMRETMCEMDCLNTRQDGAAYDYRELVERLHVACQFTNLQENHLNLIMGKYILNARQAEAEENKVSQSLLGVVPSTCRKDARVRHEELLARILVIQDNILVTSVSFSSRKRRQQEESKEQEKIRLAAEALSMPCRKFALHMAQIQAAMAS